MQAVITVKKRFLSDRHLITLKVDCNCEDEANCIELALFQVLANTKALDFTKTEGEGTEGEDTEGEGTEGVTKNKIGFSSGVVMEEKESLIGYDDGHDPFYDEEEYEEYE